MNKLYEKIRELRKQEMPLAEDYLKAKVEYHQLGLVRLNLRPHLQKLCR